MREDCGMNERHKRRFSLLSLPLRGIDEMTGGVCLSGASYGATEKAGENLLQSGIIPQSPREDESFSR